MIVKKRTTIFLISLFLLFNNIITIQALDNTRYGYLDYNDKNNGDVIDVISMEEKSLTIRKLNQRLFIYTYEDNLNLRELPDISSKILFKLDDKSIWIRTIAITRELETIDGLRDYWVKIITRTGKIGWVFGGYTSVDYYGPKYELPEIYEIEEDFLQDKEFLKDEECSYEESYDKEK